MADFLEADYAGEGCFRDSEVQLGRMASQLGKQGYSDGTMAGEKAGLQIGFNKGIPSGAEHGRKWGKVEGYLKALIILHPDKASQLQLLVSEVEEGYTGDMDQLLQLRHSDDSGCFSDQEMDSAASPPLNQMDSGHLEMDSGHLEMDSGHLDMDSGHLDMDASCGKDECCKGEEASSGSCKGEEASSGCCKGAASSPDCGQNTTIACSDNKEVDSVNLSDVLDELNDIGSVDKLKLVEQKIAHILSL